MADAAIDHASALAQARDRDSQTPKAGQALSSGLHMHGAADNYSGAPIGGKADNYPQNPNGNSNSDRLAEARKGGLNKTANTAKTIAETATPMGAFSLLKQINFLGDMPYVAAMGAALLKDLLDFVAGPTVVLSILFSALCSIFIFMMMLLVGSSGKKKGASKFLSKIGILGAGGIADSIPGIDFFPIESMTVGVIYFLTLVERKNASK